MENYTKIQVLGEGSYGKVYLMREKKTGGKLVCMKDIDLRHLGKKAQQASLGEAEIMNKLNHPNIIEYLGSQCAKNNKHLYIIMSYCSGGMHDQYQYRVQFAWMCNS